MKVDDLVASGGPAPPPPASPTKETLSELTKIYYEVYVPGLVAFFESTWYNFKPTGSNPVSILLANRTLVDLLASFLGAVSSADASEMHNAGVLETRVVWALASLAVSTPSATTPSGNALPASDDATETRHRLTVSETLLSGTSLASNPCFPPPQEGDPHRIREFSFWWWLAEYLRLQAARTDNSSAESEQALFQVRSLLDGRENRDVLYSMAILRELTPQFPASYESNLPQHFEETDARCKLAVATKYMRDQATPGGGTSNVVRRFAELALKAFVNPGINVSRGA